MQRLDLYIITTADSNVWYLSLWDSKLSGFSGQENSGLGDLKVERLVVKKGCYRKNCSAVDLIFTSRFSLDSLLKLQLKRLHVRFIQKVTKLGLLKLHLSKSD